MKTSFRIAFSLGLVILVVFLISIPQESNAQRFSHPNFRAEGGELHLHKISAGRHQHRISAIRHQPLLRFILPLR